MGSLFARPPARAAADQLAGMKIALVRGEGQPISALRTPHSAPELLLLGSERSGLPDDIVEQADHVAHIPLRGDGPDSLNVAATAAIALYERGNRMADRG
jgi:TrmH family RNA methyltransferase